MTSNVSERVTQHPHTPGERRVSTQKTRSNSPSLHHATAAREPTTSTRAQSTRGTSVIPRLPPPCHADTANTSKGRPDHSCMRPHHSGACEGWRVRSEIFFKPATVCCCVRCAGREVSRKARTFASDVALAVKEGPPTPPVRAGPIQAMGRAMHSRVHALSGQLDVRRVYRR